MTCTARVELVLNFVRGNLPPPQLRFTFHGKLVGCDP